MIVIGPLGLIIFVLFIFLFIFVFKRAFKLHEIHLFLPLLWLFITYKMEIDELPWTIVGAVLWFIFAKWLIEFIISKFDPNFTTFFKVFKLKRAGRYPGQINLLELYPELINSPVFEAIYNHCQNDDEIIEFQCDWNEYLLDMQQDVFQNPNEDSRKYYLTFDEWYIKNSRWKNTNYHHLYYEKQKMNYESC